MKRKTKKSKAKQQAEIIGEMDEKARAWDHWCEHTRRDWDEEGHIVIYTNRTGFEVM